MICGRQDRVVCVVLFLSLFLTSSVYAGSKTDGVLREPGGGEGLEMAWDKTSSPAEKDEEEAVSADKQNLPLKEGVSFRSARLKRKERLGWVWGIVTSVDIMDGRVEVAYIDYDILKRASMILEIDQETCFEKVSGLRGIKPGDHAGIDFKVVDGRLIATHVAVEGMQASAEEISLRP